MRSSYGRFLCTMALAAALLGVLPAAAGAQAVVTNGTITLGVNAEGQLNYSDGTTPENAGAWGVSFFTDYGSGTADWRDATSPGCLCEGFGVAVTDAGAVTHSGYANEDEGGAFNLTAGASVSDADSIITTATITSLPGLEITHDYHPSTSPNLYEATVTITNNTGGTVDDVLYRRVMDWDVPPTEFGEFVTIQGSLLGNNIETCDDGFYTADPTDQNCSGIMESPNTNFVDSGPADHGALFTFNFGSLLDGESRTFNIYYGAGATEADAFAALAAVGAQGIYSLGQSSGGENTGAPATFIFGFGGVGAPPIGGSAGGSAPEPATLLLLGGGVGAGLIRRYRRARG